MMLYSTSVLTEASYYFFSLSVLYFLEKGSNMRNVKYLFIGFFFLVFTVLIKPTGLILSGTVVVYLLSRKQLKNVFFPILCILTILIWGMSVDYYFFKDDEYTENVLAKSSNNRFTTILGNAAQRSGKYFRFYLPFNVFPPLLLMGDNFTKDYSDISSLSKTIGWMVSATIFIGFVSYLRKRRLNLFTLFFLSSFAISFNWSSAAYGRHISPYLLFFIIFFIYGLRTVSDNLPLRESGARNGAFTILIIVLVAFSLMNGLHNSRYMKSSGYSLSWIGLWEAIDYLRFRCTDSDVIYNNQPFAIYLETGCETVSYYNDYNHSAYITDLNVTYIVLDYFDREKDDRLLKLIESSLEEYKIVFYGRENLSRVYRVSR